jgi:DNA (cytosine-5)-methyltransferase 1
MNRIDAESETMIAVHATQDPCVSDIGFALGRNSGQENAIVFDTTQITSAANKSNPQPGDPCHTLAKGAHAPAVCFESRFARNGRGAPSELVPPLKAQSGETGNGDAAPLVAFSLNGNSGRMQVEATYVPTSMAVRRLMPIECERLQGFPDNFTLILGYRSDRTGEFGGNRGVADGPRYRALGNSMAVPVMRWIGERIMR